MTIVDYLFLNTPHIHMIAMLVAHTEAVSVSCFEPSQGSLGVCQWIKTERKVVLCVCQSTFQLFASG